MSTQKLIKGYSRIIHEIQTEIKKLENDGGVFNKLYIILDVLHDESIPHIVENMELVKEQHIIG